MDAEQIAIVVHEANRGLQLVYDDTAPADPWQVAPAEMRGITIAGVMAALDPDATPESVHALWLDLKTAAGWRYGPVKDYHARTHPCMVAYADLPHEHQVKDGLLLAITRFLAAA